MCIISSIYVQYIIMMYTDRVAKSMRVTAKSQFPCKKWDRNKEPCSKVCPHSPHSHQPPYPKKQNKNMGEKQSKIELYFWFRPLRNETLSGCWIPYTMYMKMLKEAPKYTEEICCKTSGWTFWERFSLLKRHPRAQTKQQVGLPRLGSYIYIVHMYRIYSTYVHMWCFNLLYIYTRYIYIQSYIFVCEIICGLYIANMNRACIYIYTYINWSPLSLCIFIVIMYLHCHYVYHHFTTSQKWEMFTTLMTFHYIYWLLHSSKLLHGLL